MLCVWDCDSSLENLWTSDEEVVDDDIPRKKEEEDMSDILPVEDEGTGTLVYLGVLEFRQIYSQSGRRERNNGSW